MRTTLNLADDAMVAAQTQALARRRNISLGEALSNVRGATAEHLLVL
jgi:hypothetical protein